MKLEELSLPELTKAWSAAHRDLGERTLAISDCESDIVRLLKIIGYGSQYMDQFYEQRRLLLLHKDGTYRTIIRIYEIEAEMDRRGV